MSNSPLERGYPFTHFAYRLWRIRESRGIRSKQMAEFLGVPPLEYRRYESGECLPNKPMMLELARILNIDIAKIRQWSVYSSRKLEKKVLKGALAYEDDLNKVFDHIGELYEKIYETKIDKVADHSLKNLHKNLTRIFDVPLLPTNFILIMDVLYSEEVRAEKPTYLHEITDFVAKNESLAAFVARDPVLGPFCYYTANLIFFKQNPCTDMMGCFNQLTLDQFKELLFIAVARQGLYDVDAEIPVLQQHIEFCSLSAMMVRELKPHLPKTIDFNHLYMAALLQGLGTHVLYTLIQPSLKGHGEENAGTADNLYAGLEGDLFQLVVYEAHPVVSAMIAANWNFPKEVLEVLKIHHEHPVKHVTSTCALLKVINFFVDNDFPDLSKQDLSDLMAGYPQVDVPLEAFFRTCVKLQDLKNNLIERSSTILDHVNSDISHFISQKVKEVGQQRKRPALPPKRSDFRFRPDYQKILKNVAQIRLKDFFMDVLSPRKGEKLPDFGRRVENLHLHAAFAITQDLESLSERFKISIDEVQLRLES